jgi:acetyl-CoA acetyltransferase
MAADLGIGEWYPRDKTAIAGIGEGVEDGKYMRWGRATKSEFQLACEAALGACEDAGLDPKKLDGFCSYSDDRNGAPRLAAALGVDELKCSIMQWGGGGGGGSGAVMNAVMAVATGSADYVIAFRSLCQGQFGRFGQSRAGGRVGGGAAFSAPYGLMTPPQSIGAIRGRRHMALYGTKSEDWGRIAVQCYRAANRNPRAVMYGRPITLEDHQNSRMIADPMHLYDCCQENDGAAAVLITSAERARDLKQPPVYIMSAASGNQYRAGDNPFAAEMASANFGPDRGSGVANRLYAQAGITVDDIDVAQIYENFTSMVLISLEEHGFCKVGEGGDYVQSGAIDWPNGKCPINTSGGNLAEAYIHGFELITEATRQMRGTSTMQVEGAEIALVASGPGVTPVTDSILRR